LAKADASSAAVGSVDASHHGLAPAPHPHHVARGLSGQLDGKGILVGAFSPIRLLPNIAMQAIGRTQELSPVIAHDQLTPVRGRFAVIALHLVLGTFIEKPSMMTATIPITTPPAVQGLGLGLVGWSHPSAH
jgi:hypothetical protein